jgi:4-amino-4-deoxy-L-arabinose transferase-like glycosyltransferase
MTETKKAARGADRALLMEGFVDTIAVSRLRCVVAILIVALVAFLPGLATIPPLDRDEPHIALGTKLMVETGDYADSGFRDPQRFIQPIGIHWLQLSSIALFDEGARSPIWAYRVPSLLGAITAALLTWWMALAFVRPRAALLAATLVAASPLLVAQAHLATAEAVFLASLVLVQGALARLWLRKADGPDYWLAFLLWTGLGIGILVKGLVGPMILISTVAVLTLNARSLTWLRRLAPIPGAIWLAIIIAPWIVGVGLGLAGAQVEGFLPERLALQEVYEAPPGTYAILFYPLFGPAGVFVVLAIPTLLDRINRPVILFSLAWIVPFWLAAELLPGKLPYYILPAFPAMALIGATAIDESRIRVTGWVSTYFSLNLVIWPLAVGGGAVALFFLAEDRLPFLALPFLIVAVGLGAYAFRWLYRGSSIVASTLLALFSALFLYIGLFGIVLAELTAIQVGNRLVAAGKAAVSCEEPEMVATGFFEPSLIFYAGYGLGLTSPEQAVDFLAEGGCRTAFVEARRQSGFNQHAEDIGLELNVKQEVSGFNIGNWKSVKVRVFSVEGAMP